MHVRWRMKISDFIEAHVAWKLKLRKYLDGLPVDFDVEKVRDATACALGHWLQETPGHEELKKLHAAFHQMASKVVDTSRRSGTAAARQLLASEEYAQATSAVVKALMGQSTAPPVAKAPVQPLALDFNAVVVAHMEWRTRLRKWLAGAAPDFDPAAVGRNDTCSLGKWLAAQPKTPALSQVVAAHDAFHKAASEVVKAQREDPKKAEVLLEAVVYREASSEVVNALSAWNRNH